MNSSKLAHISILQAFAIICLMMLHCVSPFSSWGWYNHQGHYSSVCNVIYSLMNSFAIPLLAFLSGYLFFYRDGARFFLNRFARLIVPFIIFGIVYVMPMIWLINLEDKSFIDICIEYFTLINSWHMWLLAGLFIVSIIIGFLREKVNNILMFIILFVLSFVKIKALPYGIAMIPELLLWFYLGGMAYKYKDILSKNSVIERAIFPLWILWIILEIDIYYHYTSSFLKLICTFVSILMLFMIAQNKTIEGTPWEFFCENMLLIYIIHEPVMVAVFKYTSWGTMFAPWICSLMMLVISFLVCLLFAKLRVRFVGQ